MLSSCYRRHSADPDFSIYLRKENTQRFKYFTALKSRLLNTALKIQCLFLGKLCVKFKGSEGINVLPVTEKLFERIILYFLKQVVIWAILN
jgi:hypothetical protein